VKFIVIPRLLKLLHDRNPEIFRHPEGPLRCPLPHLRRTLAGVGKLHIHNHLEHFSPEEIKRRFVIRIEPRFVKRIERRLLKEY
jgi:hypothetical protein